MSAKSTGKHILLQGAGWILVVVGLAAMVLPGPGLLALFAGMALLATQYEWAARLLAPVRKAALHAAADSVKSPLRIVLSLVGVCSLIGLGIYWGLGAAAPDSTGQRTEHPSSLSLPLHLAPCSLLPAHVPVARPPAGHAVTVRSSMFRRSLFPPRLHVACSRAIIIP